ncbi:hypothetical protein BC829DRAFT_119398 [Chytridium lagenaria]|nr:hypothetical protein BC829DRAFT_119398 [Chytridium lagenaria]
MTLSCSEREKKTFLFVFSLSFPALSWEETYAISNEKTSQVHESRGSILIWNHFLKYYLRTLHGYHEYSARSFGNCNEKYN